MRALVISPDRLRTWTSMGMLGIAAAGIFAIGLDNGQIMGIFMGDLAQPQNLLHEFFHDARHAAGFPCH